MRLPKSFHSKYYYLILLPVFFVFHELVAHILIDPFEPALKLLVIYLLVIAILQILLQFILKDSYKASIITLTLMSIYFFFGSAHDFLKQHLGNSIFVSYTFILPTLLLGCIFLLFYFKRSRPINGITLYLNILLVSFIVIDIATLFYKLSKEKPISVNEVRLPPPTCHQCLRPDVYVIITDEYTGSSSLRNEFGFDNSHFLNQLRQRNFHVIENAKSNYNYTVYSIASLLNMGYIKGIKKKKLNHNDIFAAQRLIDKNNVAKFFIQSGYEIHNFSPFKLFDEEPAIVNEYFIKKSSLFTSQTLISRIRRDIGFNFKSGNELVRVRKQHLYNNIKIENAIRELATKRDSLPKFVFSHLSMPHNPYYFDSNGIEVDYHKLADHTNSSNKNDYIQYLVFTNKKIMSLVDHILTSSNHLPIIILLSDHGFRQYKRKGYNLKHFDVLTAILLPHKDYSQFYNGMSHINIFRSILTTEFGQKINFLKDSSIFLTE